MTIFPNRRAALCLTLGATALICAAGIAGATTPASETPGLTQAAVVNRYAADLSEWAGSNANAVSLIRGLSGKTPVTLKDGDADTTPVTFTSPTRPMSRRDAYIALSLAREQLNALGVTHPDSEQIAAALIGGDVKAKRGKHHVRTEQLAGLLNMRASGMDWEKIAHIYNLKLAADLGNLDELGGAAAQGSGLTAMQGNN